MKKGTREALMTADDEGDDQIRSAESQCARAPTVMTVSSVEAAKTAATRSSAKRRGRRRGGVAGDGSSVAGCMGCSLSRVKPPHCHAGLGVFSNQVEKREREDPDEGVDRTMPERPTRNRRE